MSLANVFVHLDTKIIHIGSERGNWPRTNDVISAIDHAKISSNQRRRRCCSRRPIDFLLLGPIIGLSNCVSTTLRNLNSVL